MKSFSGSVVDWRCLSYTRPAQVVPLYLLADTGKCWIALTLESPAAAGRKSSRVDGGDTLLDAGTFRVVLPRMEDHSPKPCGRCCHGSWAR